MSFNKKHPVFFTGRMQNVPYRRLLLPPGAAPRWNNQLRGKALKQTGPAALGRMIQSQNMNNLGLEKQLPCSLDKGAEALTPPWPEWRHRAAAVCYGTV